MKFLLNSLSEIWWLRFFFEQTNVKIIEKEKFITKHLATQISTQILRMTSFLSEAGYIILNTIGKDTNQFTSTIYLHKYILTQHVLTMFCQTRLVYDGQIMYVSYKHTFTTWYQNNNKKMCECSNVRVCVCVNQTANINW